MDTIEIRKKTDSEKIDWMIGQLALLHIQEETRESKLDYLISTFDEIRTRLRRIENA